MCSCTQNGACRAFGFTGQVVTSCVHECNGEAVMGMFIDLSCLEDEPAVRRPEPTRPSADELTGDWRVLWDERAAIREYDGGQPREVAEHEALLEVLAMMQEAERQG